MNSKLSVARLGAELTRREAIRRLLGGVFVMASAAAVGVKPGRVRANNCCIGPMGTGPCSTACPYSDEFLSCGHTSGYCPPSYPYYGNGTCWYSIHGCSCTCCDCACSFVGGSSFFCYVCN